MFSAPPHSKCEVYVVPEPTRGVTQGGWVGPIMGGSTHGLTCPACPESTRVGRHTTHVRSRKREFFIDNLLVRIHFIVEMI